MCGRLSAQGDNKVRDHNHMISKFRSSAHWDCNINLNPLSANFTKWSNTLKQFVDKLPTNCLSVFGHFVGLAPKGLS